LVLFNARVRHVELTIIINKVSNYFEDNYICNEVRNEESENTREERKQNREWKFQRR